MTKSLTALVAAATLAASLAGSATEASAQRGGAVAAGIIGGLAAGAIIGGAIASQPPGYVVYPGYYGEPVYGPGCYWTRMPVYDAWGNVIGYRGRPVQVCP
jgi:hypothetical protein